jgi:thiol-disulfide isomerase/thioredoxin
MKPKVVILVIVLVSIIAVAFFSMRPVKRPQLTQTGQEVQDFTVTGTDHNTTRLSDFRGSVVFINFWATWCGSCVDEMPSIEKLFGMLAGNPSFRMITILYKDDLNRALSYMKENRYTFPVYLNQDESAARIFGITGIPETFIIDKKGYLREKIIGPSEWDSPRAVAAIQALLNER